MKLSEVLPTIALAVSAAASPTRPPCLRDEFRWVDLPAIGGGVPIQEQGTAATDSHIYLLGGIPPNASNYQAAVPSTSRFEAYSLDDGTWQTLPPIPRAFTHTNAAAVGSRVYVLGGLTGDGADKIWRASGDCFVYDIAAGTWAALPPMPAGQARGAAAVAVLGATIYLAGGMERLEVKEGGAQTSLTLVTAYDTAAGTWTALPALPAPRDHAGAAVVGRALYVVGGRDRGQPNVRNTTWTLDLAAPRRTAGGWTARAQMPTARGGLAVGVLGQGAYIAALGGEGNPDPASSGVFNETEVYDVRRDTWARLPAMPHPRHGTVAASARDRVYVPGGGVLIGAGPVDTFDALELVRC
ncbi:galactose oxidase [Durotheca rogersii]|uniref:galactose oxidase n=1 Tax=Durotheca rogersii TaxID=419775 RepID=UPI002220DE1B|nr:galactose oxidase [Durotheca rogersii]KAI5863863.1 galactose oxidase [Durotheca rogersii]